MIKNDGTYFIVTFEEDKKYPEEIEPFSYKGIELLDRKSTRLNSSHIQKSRMPSSA